MDNKDSSTRFERLEQQADESFSLAGSEQELRAERAKFLGPSGEVKHLLQLIPTLAPEQRKSFGQRANQCKQRIEQTFSAALTKLQLARDAAALERDAIDPTLPGRAMGLGSLHPLTQTAELLLGLLERLGFAVVEGPELETYANNFEKLGFPPDHPATDMQDSFFVHQRDAVGRPLLLRTHTSTVQVREMMRRQPPLAIVSPGVVYRRDDDVTHSPMFFQVEGLVVDEDVSFADLKGVLTQLLRQLFGETVKTRFRPSYFPFVEPGGEVDIDCGSGWMEILGCGMVHPTVFEHVGYDPERYQGFAFGMGIDRITMLRHGISDIRLLYDNDIRFLRQF